MGSTGDADDTDDTDGTDGAANTDDTGDITALPFFNLASYMAIQQRYPPCTAQAPALDCVAACAI